MATLINAQALAQLDQEAQEAFDEVIPHKAVSTLLPDQDKAISFILSAMD